MIKSPLRYPGGKSRAVKIIRQYIPDNVKEVCSPFLGGGSLELDLANNGIDVYASDIFEPLITFWEWIFLSPKSLANSIEKYYPMDKVKFTKMQKELSNNHGDKGLETAAKFFVLNRCSFSGTTLSGGMSNNHPRFTLSAIDRVRNFKSKRFKGLYNYEYRQMLCNHPYMFVYADPPYLIDSKLYGKNGDLHTTFNHEELSDYLRYRKSKWLLSYNDCPEIRDMYRDFRIIPVQWQYGMSDKKDKGELLICNY